MPSIIVNDTKKSLENDIGARKLEAKCTMRQPVYFYFYQQFQPPKHRSILRQTAPLSNLVLKSFSSVQNSKNIESIALV